MDNVEKLRRNKGGSEPDTFIRSEEVGEYLKAAGMKPTHQELLMALRECGAFNDGVKFSVLEKWLKKQVMQRKSGTRNPLLVNDVVGKTTASSYDLLGKNHTYGVAIQRDKEHGADVIFKWDTAKPVHDEDADMYVDRVKMNIDAVKKGRTTAKEFVDHGRTTKRYSSYKKKARMRNSTRGAPLNVDQKKTFGQMKSQETPPIKGLIQSDYNKHVTEEDSNYVRSSGSQKTKQQARALRQQLKTTRLTRAQRLRNTQIRGQLNPEPVKKFKMKQFSNVQSRLSATGSRVMSA